MKEKLIYCGALSLMLTVLFSFSGKEQPPDFTTEVYSRFYSYLDNFREEKVYLQTDKPYYSAGENIWFKGYLVNAATLRPESFSNFIYVELINREDSIITRVKIQRDTTGFSGHINLDQEIPSGDYSLRAYSQWMRNNSSDFFFIKNIRVGNRIEELISLQTTYGELTDSQVEVRIHFADEHALPVSDKKLEISGRWLGSRRRNMTLTTSSQGDVSFDLPVDTVEHFPKVLDVTLDMEEYKFETKVYLPDFSNDFHMQFFPESGALLDSGVQYVAFKAIGTDGVSKEISGRVYSQKGEELTRISTKHNGTGKFGLYTVPGESYYAIVQSEQGVEKRFELPDLETEGVALRLISFQDKVNYSIINHLPNQLLPLYLLIHSNGKPFIVAPFSNLTGQVDISDLDPGISSFSIIDSLGNVYCERLFFKRPASLPTISMQPDQEVYGKRELVNLSFKIQSEQDKTSEGFYSLSVTDSHYVKQDTINDNIISNLLLSSDIKGHIENPTSYFTNDTVSSEEKLDLLMLTQGWTRYNTSDLLKDQLQQGDHLIEVSQTLTGRVVNLFGRPVKDRDVYGLVSGNVIATKTDSFGKYAFDGIGFQDSVSFVLRAQRNKGIVDVKIVPDLETFPDFSTDFSRKSNEQRTEQDDYFDQSKLRFFSDGGIRHILLDELTVKARRKKRVVNENYLGIMADVITSEQLDRMRNLDLLTILRTMPGVMVMNNQVSIRNNPGPPLFIVDGIQGRNFDDVQHITTDDIDNIQVLKDATASFFGPGGSNGVIAINTKRGEINAPKKPISMATVTPLGCQKPEQFYVPKYDVKSKRDNPNPDLRTTIYWNPALSTDSSGMVNVEFYTADPNNDYSVVLEGVTKEGEVSRYEGMVNRK
ncbi:MAG: TonB-dependent receptor plug domain-containing protein [Bacteroidales bacterium]|nr:TonB-dependent receptor plug domain-containing protein [Bacteroidales bacterium]